MMMMIVVIILQLVNKLKLIADRLIELSKDESIDRVQPFELHRGILQAHLSNFRQLEQFKKDLQVSLDPR